MRIETHRPKIPWTWVGWMMLPWVSFHYTELCSGAPLTFTLRKFIEQPSLIALLSSLNIAFNFMVGAIASYLSDGIWTRWGRRRPFLIIGWTGVAATLLAIPWAGSLWTLVPLIVLYQFFQDVAKPLEPLHNDVVPPPQRGRAGMLRNLAQSSTALIFNGVILAQFDRQYGLEPLGLSRPLRGEVLVYAVGALIAMAAVLFLLFGVRETAPARPPERGFRFADFLREVFGERRWWLVYGLYVCPTLAGAACYLFFPLLLTEQLGLSKATYGRVEALTMLTNLLCFIPLAGFLVDRVSRLTLLKVAIAGAALINLGFFFLLHTSNGPLPLSLIIALSLFGGMSGALVALKYVVWGPLVYDFIPSDRYGTVSAGFAFVGGLTGFLLINAGGAWVQWVGSALAPLSAGSGAPFNYSSIFLLQGLTSAAAYGYCHYFERQLQQGRVRRYGASPAPDDRGRH